MQLTDSTIATDVRHDCLGASQVNESADVAPLTGDARRTTTHSRARLAEAVDAARAALESVHANVFVAGTGLELVHMNRRAEAEVRLIEMTARERFTDIWSEMIDNWIHRLPSSAEVLLQRPAIFPRETVLSFGNITLNTHLSGLFDDTSQPFEPFGYVVVWHDTSTQQTIKTTTHALAYALAAASPR